MSANPRSDHHRTTVEDFVLNHHVIPKKFQKINNPSTPSPASSGRQFGTAVNSECQRLASRVVGGKEELIWTVKLCRNLYTGRYWELGEAYDEATDDLYDIEVGIEVEYSWWRRSTVRSGR
ncbi:hypothetical protein IFR04_015311 [Cadophora malorum]|uniref:Uncharacterized protein n=1 Tax=Cadophora malorum TaxID=108018 RepID=A0A8H7W1D7_9HELO|nr:hypothetical protein IFR04_015311 [Cadophora malorum]